MPLNPDTNPRILIFDSGVGGLSIMAEIQAQLPHCPLIYASDNAAFPYGTKSETTLVDRVDTVLHHILSYYSVDIIVLACNSASTLALPRIRSRFTQPIVGVVPAIKPAADLTQNKTIGLLATPGTITREYTKELIQAFAPECQVISIGSSDLVQLAEDYLRRLPVSISAIKKIIEPFFSPKQGLSPDVVVLACTHFPLLKPLLVQAAPYPIQWIDSGQAIARRVEQLLEGRVQIDIPPPQHISVFTADTPDVAVLAQELFTFNCESTTVINIPWITH